MARTLLIVDDEIYVLKMLRKMLHSDDHIILEAENGVQALKCCYENDIDLIITDIVMPEKHGIDLILQVQKDYPDMPIIAISGGGGVQGRFNYLEVAGLLGIIGVLQKPFDKLELIGIVNTALGVE